MELALAAYLDGFEPVEPLLLARDGKLMARIETTMSELRASLGRRAAADAVAGQVTAPSGLFDEAGRALAPSQASALSTFLGAFTVLCARGWRPC